MAGKLLTELATIQCPHGGIATVTSGNQKVSADGAKVLLESDVHQVAGCSFTLPGPKPSPCLTIEWQAGTVKSNADGTKMLTETSVGLCKSGEGLVQGTAMISYTQQKVEGM